MGHFRTIVADPPWPTKTGPSWGKLDKSAPLNAASHALVYPTMLLPAIAALPVAAMAQQNAHLYLWTTNGFLEQAFGIVRGWGFRPATVLTWCKPPKGIGLGGAFSLTTEFCIFARRGVLPSLQRFPTTWFGWPRHALHSRKPEAFQDVVEAVSPGPYLELFARRPRVGWSVWGNEVDSDIELLAA